MYRTRSIVTDNQENTLPNWLNEVILSNILQQNVKYFRKILKYDFQSRSQSNPNEGALKIEMELEGDKKRSVQYVLKIQPTEDSTKSSTFSREFYVYDKLLPAFEQLYADIGVEVKFSQTNLLSTLRKPNAFAKSEFILLEDTLSKCYRRVNKSDGLDINHMEPILKKLASFHAASAVYATQQRSASFRMFFDTKSKTLKHEKELLAERDVVMNRKFIEGLRFYDLREYQDKIRSFSKFFEQQRPEFEFNRDTSEFNVLLHGNCWPDSFLCSYDAFGRIKDVLLTNFTNSHWGSPARDLLALLLSAPSLTIKTSKFDYFVKVYHDELCANLKLLNFRKVLPTLTDLHIAILKYHWWGFEVIRKILPVVLLSPGLSDFNINDMLIYNNALNTVLINEAYANPRYASEIVDILPWMENRGFLEE